MGTVSDSFSASANSPSGIAAAALLDAIIIIIVGIVDLVGKHTIGNLSSVASFAIVLAIAVVLLLTAFLLYKGKMAGYILAWVAAIGTLAFGVVLLTGKVDSTMIFKIYYLLTGVIMAFFLIPASAREGLS